MQELHEECGIFGVYSPIEKELQNTVYYGLFALQHRGQESCGIVLNCDGVFQGYKELGIVSDVFKPEVLEGMGRGKIALGHVRYASSDSNNRKNTQPIDANHIKGRIAIGINGCITNSKSIRENLELKGSIFTTTSDAELIAHVIISERLKTSSIEEAVSCAMTRLEGAYSLGIMTSTKLLAVRDPHGIRPLCYGELDDGTKIIASESCALESVGARLVRDVSPGEILVINEDGVQSITHHVGKAERALCIFEYIYFGRPDSKIEGYSVHKARINAGKFLARAFPAEADIVIGAPDSGIDAALGFSEESGIPYETGFVKNKYIGRTFIAPKQEMREDLVKIKLNPIRAVVEGKRLVLVDDSIVRGTTSKKIVKLLKDFGAKEVHMRISSPPFIGLCHYGTDIDKKENLIAVSNSVEEIRKSISADSLGFLKMEDMLKITDDPLAGFCRGCFDEIYPTPVPNELFVSRFDQPLSLKK